MKPMRRFSYGKNLSLCNGQTWPGQHWLWGWIMVPSLLSYHCLDMGDFKVRMCYLAKKDVFNCHQIIFSIYIENKK